MNYRQIMERLTEAMFSIDTAYAKLAQHHGLQYNSLFTLYVIAESNDVTQSRICERLKLSKSTVHSIYRDLENKGYVTLVKGRNQKEKYIVFTEQGVEFFKQINHDTQVIETETYSAMGDNAMTEYLLLTEKFSHEMNKSVENMFNKELK